MTTNNFGCYDYNELLKKATAPNAEQIDIDTLGAWFSEYGTRYWNGEYYDADSFRLFPVYDWDEETDQGEIVHYELC